MNKLDIKVGDKFGEWTVIDIDRFSKHGHTYVQCKCSCGNIKDIASTALKRGKTSKCKKCAARSKTTQLQVGSSIKDWTILEGPVYVNSTAYYKVQCKCGKVLYKLPLELLDSNKYFCCDDCAHVKNMEKIRKQNGQIGDLTKTMFTRIKRAAEARKIKFDVTMGFLWNLFLEQERLCAITGDRIDHIGNASLDRIDSTGEYTEGNVQWVTKQANLSKHVMSMKELYEFCQKVLNHANQQPSTSLTTCEGSETNG